MSLVFIISDAVAHDGNTPSLSIYFSLLAFTPPQPYVRTKS